MKFIVDLAFAVELLALAAGGAFLVWACQTEGPGRRLAKAYGIVITLLALLALGCTTYYSTVLWMQGQLNPEALRHMLPMAQ